MICGLNPVTVTSRILGVMWANITYHVEHHLYPRVPCHRLPELHALMRGRDYITSPSSSIRSILAMVTNVYDTD